MAEKTTLIPIQMCFDALKNKKTRALQVFIFLKFECSGKIKLDKHILRKASDTIGLKSEKTVKAQINFLEDIRWISVSKRSGYYFIKGYNSICKAKHYRLRSSAEFDLKELQNFKSFLIAAVISYLIKKQKVRLTAVELKRRGSKTSAFICAEYFPIANEALAKILGISVSTAFEWKKLAEKQGFITIRKNFRVIEDVQPQFLNDFKKYGEIQAKKLRLKNGSICELLPDDVSTKVYLRKRRKIFLKTD